MTNDVELLASYWTIAGGALPHTDREYSPFDFKDRVQAAAKAGSRAWEYGTRIWIIFSNVEAWREMKQILDDNGITHLELEFLSDWFLEGERKKQSDIQKRKLLTAAETLGAHHVKVGDFYHEKYFMPQLIEAFSALCADAADPWHEDWL